MIRPVEMCESVTEWTVFNTDTINLAVSAGRAQGTYSIEFDKVDGAANTTIAGAYRTVAFDWRDHWFAHDRIFWGVEVSAVTNVASAFIRLGTSASHYAEFRFADTSLVAGAFTLCSAKLGDFFRTGNGIDWSAITYLAVGVNFDAEGNALADIKVDNIYLAKVELTN